MVGSGQDERESGVEMQAWRGNDEWGAIAVEIGIEMQARNDTDWSGEVELG
jgi:hypothetical protein